jgi:hypothetical protein
LETEKNNFLLQMAPYGYAPVLMQTRPIRPTYAAVIAVAIASASERRLKLNDIYAFVERHMDLVPSASQSNWKVRNHNLAGLCLDHGILLIFNFDFIQNSVRHNLSLRSCFVKKPRYTAGGKKLCAYWELDESQLPVAASIAVAHVRMHGDIRTLPIIVDTPPGTDDERSTTSSPRSSVWFIASLSSDPRYLCSYDFTYFTHLSLD